METTIKLTQKPNLSYIMDKWIGKICPEDKGGSFNLKLYLDYLKIKNQRK